MSESNHIKHNISLLVSNKPGVLSRIAMVFTRRGYNIESLVVSAGQTHAFSRMNIEAWGDEKSHSLMLAQLNRLIDVIHAVDHSKDNVIQRELGLIKISCDSNERLQVLQIADTFRSQTVDISDETITFQIIGKSSKLDAFIKMIKPYGIKEIVRTGKVLMSRGVEATA